MSKLTIITEADMLAIIAECERIMQELTGEEVNKAAAKIEELKKSNAELLDALETLLSECERVDYKPTQPLRMELFRRLEIGDAVFAFGGYTRVKKMYANGKHIMVENCEQKACVDDVVFLLK